MTKARESYSYKSFQKKYHVSPSGYSINATQDYELNTMSLQFDGAYNQPTDAIFLSSYQEHARLPPYEDALLSGAAAIGVGAGEFIKLNPAGVEPSPTTLVRWIWL